MWLRGGKLLSRFAKATNARATANRGADKLSFAGEDAIKHDETMSEIVVRSVSDSISVFEVLVASNCIKSTDYMITLGK